VDELNLSATKIKENLITLNYVVYESNFILKAIAGGVGLLVVLLITVIILITKKKKNNQKNEIVSSPA
jgi:hypothetical protein